MQSTINAVGLMLCVLAVADAQPVAAVSVDSTYPGYGAGVIGDGKWVELDKQTTTDYGNVDRLGNAGNTWVSGQVKGVEHWVRLDWAEAVEVNQVTVWWVESRWYSRAFRVETLSDQNWVPVGGPRQWLAATEQKSVMSFKPIKARALRVLQHSGGGPDEGFLALQEMQAMSAAEATEGVVGARVLSAEELAEIEPVALERNVARLHVRQPGADEAMVWKVNGSPVAAPELNDGDTETAAPNGAPIIQWPIQHVLDGVQVWFAGTPPEAKDLHVEVHGGDISLGVSPISTGRSEEGRWVRFVLEPVAARAVRVRLPEDSPAVTELEAYRYLPASPSVWPERLVKDNEFERGMLASGREPSFAELSTVALSMTPARALLGLKDDPNEAGVTWDGTVLSAWPLEFSFGAKAETLAKYRDTVTRTLVDGWRPGTAVKGRVGDLEVTETAFVSFAGEGRTRAALFVRVEVRNVGAAALQTSVNVAVKVRGGDVKVAGGAASVGGKVVLAGPAEAQATERPGALSVALELGPGEAKAVDLVQPYGAAPDVAEASAYQAVRYEDALAGFRVYWDEVLAPAAKVDVPEEQVGRMYKAVLAQLYVNADGDIMPYGAAPGVYNGNLYGVEESFAMFALAWAGFGAEVERYMDATYLTPEFLVKVPEYRKYADRHQQYRNGLQPHFAVQLFRITRNRAWIEKHVGLIRECAEWTMRERKATMALENGERPLHWGLLPKWSYGGDISELQCYALYANYCCWQGLVDTAWLLAELGDAEAAARYAGEAKEYSECIRRAALGNIQRDQTPAFLPLQLYATKPVGDDYDQLFDGCLLDLGALEPEDEVLRTLMEYMEGANLTFCRLPRFRRDAGAGGLDGLYGLGYLLTKLQQGRRDEFLLGFYAYLAFNLERETFAARETNLIYASDLHVRSSYPVPDMSDPVPCSAAVAVMLLRNMLVCEAAPVGGKPSGELRLLWGAPKAWFADGKVVRFEGMPTDFGEVSCEVRSRASEGRVEATVRGAQRAGLARIALRLPHPEGKPMQRVTVNGEAWGEFDAEGPVVRLRPGAGEVKVVAEY